MFGQNYPVITFFLLTFKSIIYSPSPKVAGDDIRQKLEFHHTHLELGALGYVETFLFYWSWVFFKITPHQGRFSFLKIQGI